MLFSFFYFKHWLHHHLNNYFATTYINSKNEGEDLMKTVQLLYNNNNDNNNNNNNINNFLYSQIKETNT